MYFGIRTLNKVYIETLTEYDCSGTIKSNQILYATTCKDGAIYDINYKMILDITSLEKDEIHSYTIYEMDFANLSPETIVKLTEEYLSKIGSKIGLKAFSELREEYTNEIIQDEYYDEDVEPPKDYFDEKVLEMLADDIENVIDDYGDIDDFIVYCFEDADCKHDIISGKLTVSVSGFPFDEGLTVGIISDICDFYVCDWGPIYNPTRKELKRFLERNCEYILDWSIDDRKYPKEGDIWLSAVKCPPKTEFDNDFDYNDAYYNLVLYNPLDEPEYEVRFLEIFDEIE